MDFSLADQDFAPLGRSLTLSLCLTGLMAAAVCTPPTAPIDTFRQILARATAYLLLAALIHALAVWAACRFPREHQTNLTSRHIAPIALCVWITVVWLPLLALLTSEHSPWVALVLPVIAAFATRVLLWGRTIPTDDFDTPTASPRELLHIPQEQPLWQRILPALLTAIALELAIGLLGADHAWIAGLLFAAAAAFLTRHFVNRTLAPQRRSALGTSAGNSITVWTLLAFALMPFLVIVGGRMAGLLGIHAVHAASRLGSPILGHKPASGYTGIILTRPPKPHEVVTPKPLSTTTTTSALRKPDVIKFDGAYWYFQAPDTRPSHGAHRVQGDPLKNHIRSTDDQPLLMEAHQPLGKPVLATCCRALRVDLVNGDAVPGSITLEVLLREPVAGKDTLVSLGSKVLPSSTVSPMPLHRGPVRESLSFSLPRSAQSRSFDEITLRIKPERRRSLAGARVSIEQFVLAP